MLSTTREVEAVTWTGFGADEYVPLVKVIVALNTMTKSSSKYLRALVYLSEDEVKEAMRVAILAGKKKKKKKVTK